MGPKQPTRSRSKTDQYGRQPGAFFRFEKWQAMWIKKQSTTATLDGDDTRELLSDGKARCPGSQRKGKVLILLSGRGDDQPSTFRPRRCSVRFVRNEQFVCAPFFPSLLAFKFPLFFGIFSFLFVQFLQPLFLLIICPFGHKISRLRNGVMP